MILAAGLSPAWQQILEFDQVRPGEVNRALAAHWWASGKVLNVARACHRLGSATRALTILGGPAGEAISANWSREQLEAQWVSTSTPTRTCTTLLEAATGVVTELVENARPIDRETLDRFCAAYREEVRSASIVVLTGSLPPGAPFQLYAELLGITAARAVLDVRGPDLLAALAMKPLLVKPNREELAQTLGRPLNDDRELQAAIGELHDRGAEWVLVTQGAGPAWLCSPCVTLRLPPYPVQQVRNPIGCGDCVAAGIAVALEAGESMPDAVRLGLAAAAENASGLLPADIDNERVRSIIQRPGPDATAE